MQNKKAKILVVDDEPLILHMIEMTLKDEDLYELSFAKDAFVSLKYLEEHDFDAVVSDINMPGLDGLQLLKAISE